MAYKTHTKRKIVLEESDDEVDGTISALAYKKRLTTRRQVSESSPETSARRTLHIAPIANDTYVYFAALAKKARIVMSEDEDDEADDAIASFSSRLTKFKKSSNRKSRSSRSGDDDDDDFIIPDHDSDEEDDALPSRSASRASSRSSRTSSINDEEDEVLRKPKKSTSRSVPKKSEGSSITPSGGSSNFLTAAERCTQAVKKDKKETDSPFSFLLDPKDKDGVRPGEPGYDPRTLYIPKSSWREFTPFEKQFWEIKQNHFDTVLFFQKGFYSLRMQLYEEDAVIGHREFDLKLTQRVKMSMVGVPEMSFNFWAAKFLAKGYKVGRVDQAETALGAEMRLAAAKGKGKVSEDKQKDKIVRRELNKVYTNGTLVDEALLTDDQAGHCVSLREEEGQEGTDSFGICVLDSATSEFNLSAFEDDVCRTRLETMMRQLRPKEIIFTKGNLSPSTTRLLKVVLPDTCLWTSLRDVEGFNYDQALKELEKLYVGGKAREDEDMDREDMSHIPEAIRDLLGSKNAIESLGAMMWYLRQLNIDKDILTMRNFNVYDPMKRGQGLVLDGQTLAHIEVLLNNEGSEDGSLLQFLQRCSTPFGKRLFRIWLCMPLRNVDDINARLDAVEDLMQHPSFEADFISVTKGLPDLERLVSRIHAKNCKVKDFLKALASFRKLSKGLAKLADDSESFKSRTVLGLLRSAPDLIPHIKNVESRFQTPERDQDDLIPVEGKDEEYDKNRAEMEELEAELDKQLKKLQKQVNEPLSYWHSHLGNKDIYLVETKAGAKVPRDWVKSGGTKARALRLLSGSPIRSLKEARERKDAIMKSFKFRVFEEFDRDRGTWLRAVRVLAELDCLLGLAKSSTALDEPSCRPTLVDDEAAWVDFKSLRHPVLAARSHKTFIPNDVALGGDKGRIALLTGPNMGGKSTAMRMTATSIIMAQLGMYVPAKTARLSPVDAILTRMGAYDNMFSNASTFKVELDECCKILRDATPKSFVILDELGRGTSTYDGMAIAGAVLHQLATHIFPLSFFATHYGSLTDDYAYHPNIRNMHMQTMVNDEERELTFLYKLVDGIATGSFGTHVASLAGVPSDVVSRATVVSEDFANQFRARVEGKRARTAEARIPLVAQADFAFLHALVTGRQKLDKDPVRRKGVLTGLKAAVSHCLVQASTKLEA
ncbi:muts domain V-domain-containing protein [Vararia minispora EC-137]|uniref:Muts domain V-domain-containing protein n=1 Tax=Vararia minispora EC-137 TaxID=1314806 RepID=A0ACB8QI63_9AGAM|nr:muts domain V-domain-containing protein [Vararia minispora EC-137]